MNRNNALRVQLHRSKVTQTDRVLEIAGPNGRAYGYAAPPSWEEDDRFTEASAAKTNPAEREFVEAHPTILHATRAILANAALADAMDHMRSEDSPTRRAAGTQAAGVTAIKAIAKAAADHAVEGQALRSQEAVLYAPTKLPPNDLHEALADREIRDRWNTQPVTKRTQSLHAMASGHDDRTLEALIRSPVALEPNVAELVNGAWRKAVARRNPKTSSDFESAKAHHEWADSVVKAAAFYASRSGALSAQAITEAAAGTGGEHLFNPTTAADHAA